jgi:flagellar biosynthesis protein FlhA
MPSPSLTTTAPRRHALDWVVPIGILLAVMVVLAPVPAALLDILLAANLTLSVLALLGAIAARTPLELSIFPTFLLGSTLVRLVLNVATTRLVLSRAAIDGADAAGEVVKAFGQFVAANDLIVGGVIFAIIAVIQFVVITAGSTRTSEVAARFAIGVDFTPTAVPMVIERTPDLCPPIGPRPRT